MTMYNKPMNTPQPPQQKYSLAQLQEYIQLHYHLTGITLKEVIVSKEYIAWYQEQIKQISKDFNIPTTKNFKKTAFRGLELLVKE